MVVKLRFCLLKQDASEVLPKLVLVLPDSVAEHVQQQLRLPRLFLHVRRQRRATAAVALRAAGSLPH